MDATNPIYEHKNTKAQYYGIPCRSESSLADQGNSSSAKGSPRSVRLSIFYSIDSSVPGLVEDPVLSQSRLAPPPVDPSQVVKVVLQPGDNQVVLQAFSSGAQLAGCVLNQPKVQISTR